MSKKTTQVNTAPKFVNTPATLATNNLQSMVDTPVDHATPIRNAYGRAEQNRHRSYNNPLGAHTNADVRDKALRSEDQEANQNMGLDLANAAQQSSADKFNRQATVAGFTQPQMYATGGTSKTSDPWGTAMGIGSAITSPLTAGLGGSKKSSPP